MIGWIRSRLSFAVLRATMLCMQGSRSRWRPLGIVDGASADPSGVTLIADLCVHGVWQPQVDVLFDVCVIDTDAPSYRSRSPQVVLSSVEAEKKHRYLEACWPIMLVSRPCVFQPMACLGQRRISFSVVWLIDYLLSGRGHTVK